MFQIQIFTSIKGDLWRLNKMVTNKREIKQKIELQKQHLHISKLENYSIISPTDIQKTKTHKIHHKGFKDQC